MALTATLEFTVPAGSQQSQAHGISIEGVAVRPESSLVDGGWGDVIVGRDATNVTVTNDSAVEVTLTVTVEHWFTAGCPDVIKAYSKQVCIDEGETEASAEQIATDNLETLQSEALSKWESVISNEEAEEYTNAPWALVKSHLESWIIANLL